MSQHQVHSSDTSKAAALDRAGRGLNNHFAPHMILVVDDEPDICEILCLTFESKGYRTLRASNGREALQIFKSNKVDLIISDIQMADGSGIELLAEIKKAKPDFPIILFITESNEITIEEAFDKGAEAVFSKPFENKVLLKAVTRVISEFETNHKAKPALREATDCKISVRFAKSELLVELKVLNLGRGGFFISLSDVLPDVGDAMSFEMNLGPRPEVNIKGGGIVRWVRSSRTSEYVPGCGVEFTSFEGSGRKCIIEYINFLKTTQYIPRR